jgi:hypothetical protein
MRKKHTAKPDQDLMDMMESAGKGIDARIAGEEAAAALAALDMIKSAVKLGQKYGDNLEGLDVPTEAFEKLGPNGRFVALIGIDEDALDAALKARKKK